MKLKKTVLALAAVMAAMTLSVCASAQEADEVTLEAASAEETEASEQSDPSAEAFTLGINDVEISASTTLEEDMTVTGNLYLHSQYFDLNGHTLTVHGNLNHTYGHIDVNGGKLVINGDYVNATADFDSSGRLIESSLGQTTFFSDFYMSKEEDVVQIDGNMWEYSSGQHRFWNGTLTIGGNIYCWRGGTIFHTTADGTHKLIFKGDSINNYTEGYMFFNQLQTTKPQITVGGPVGILRQLNDLNVISDPNNKFKLIGWLGNGYDLNVKGDTDIDPSSTYGSYGGKQNIELDGQSITVDGNVMHYGGNIYFNGGKLHITGNYANARLADDGSYTWASGCPRMSDENDVFTVDGDYYCDYTSSSATFHNGTLTIGGDITDASTDFRMGEGMTFIFKGDHITNTNRGHSYSSYSGFTNMYVENGTKTVTLTGCIGLGTLQCDFTVIPDDLILYHMDANGHEITFEGDLDVYNSTNGGRDFYLTDGKMTVKGDLVNGYGAIYVKNGELDVEGDYIAGIPNDNGGYDMGYGFIRMTDAGDAVNIGGDLISDVYGSHILNAGTLTLGGDILDKSNDIYSGGDHTFVFRGKKITCLPYGVESFISFKNLKTAEPVITVEGRVDLGILGNDLTVVPAGDFVLKGFNCNGHTLTINTGCEIYGNRDLKINGGRLAVKGDVYQPRGEMIVGGGTLEILGDYILAQRKDDGSYERTSGYDYLTMNEENDVVNVTGDFYTAVYSGHYLKAGTLTVCGDVTDADNDIAATGTHKFIFKGKKITADFAGASNKHIAFRNFETTSPVITVKGYVGFGVLGCDVNVKSDGMALCNFDCNKHTLSIDGDVTIDFYESSGERYLNINGGTLSIDGNVLHKRGYLYIGGGMLDISGNYVLAQLADDGSYGRTGEYCVLRMENDDDAVNVGGDFYTSVYSVHVLKAGKLYIAGNFDDMDKDFNANGTHTTILNGEDHQTIDFHDGGRTFNILRLTKPLSNYTFLPDNCWKTLITDTAAVYDVRFDVNGGSAVEDQTVEEGGKAVKPVDPTKDGFTFAGWFADIECTKAYDFKTPVTANITIYAKWTENEADTFTVKFNVNGGSAVASQSVESGNAATEPEDPTKDGFTFAGWFTDSKFTAAYDFSEPVTADITLYAKWKANAAALPANLKVTAGNAQAALTWDAVSGAVKYRVFTYLNGKFTAYANVTGTSCTVKNLTNGTKYGFLVLAYNGTAWSSYSVKDVVYATPAAPAAGAVKFRVHPGDGQVSITWNAVSGAKKYRVFRYQNKKFVSLGDVTTTGYMVNDLVNGTKYGFLVLVNDGKTWSRYTVNDVVYATPSASSAALPVLRTSAGNRQVSLSWDAVTGAKKYRVFKYLNKKFTAMADVSSTSYMADDLANGTKYGFLVLAYNGKSWSKYTAEDAVYAAPNAAAAALPILRVSAGDKQVSLSWDAVTGAKKYRVFKYQNGKFKSLGDVKTTAYMVNGLANGTSCGFIVLANNGSAWSKYTSEDVVYAVPKASAAALPALSAKAGRKQVTLSWSAVTGAKKYRVFRYLNGKFTSVLDLDGSSLSCTIKNLTPGTEYGFLVLANNGKGWSKYTVDYVVYAVPTK